MDITRRSFVKSASVAGMAAAAASAVTVGIALAEEVTFDQEVDVVIAGAGGAGMAAALMLQEQGADFVVFESEASCIPSTFLSGGGITLCEIDMAPGTADELYEDLMATSDYECQEDLVRAYVDNASAVYEKLLEWGLEFGTTAQAAHMSQPWMLGTVGEGRGVMNPIYSTFEERGGQVLTSHRVTRLVMDGRKVVGVVVETPEGPKTVAARKGVLLATGDFSRNVDLIKNFGAKNYDAIIPVSGQGSRGDGLLMGMYAGAGICFMRDGIYPTAPVGHTTGFPGWMFTVSGTTCYDMGGRRFYNESDSYVDVLIRALEQGTDLFFQAYDTSHRDAMMELYESGVTTSYNPNETEYVGETIEELGEAIAADYPEFDVAAFVDEVARYNGFVHAGVDEDFGAISAPDAKPAIETGPFYAQAFNVGTDHFANGLTMDAEGRVLNVYGEPIEGLYAAGTVAGGLSCHSYMSGSMVGRALIQGYIAAKTLA